MLISVKPSNVHSELLFKDEMETCVKSKGSFIMDIVKDAEREDWGVDEIDDNQISIEDD